MYCNLKEGGKKREIGTSNIEVGNHEVTSWSNTMFTRQPFSFPIESLPAFLAIHNIKKYRGKGRFVRGAGGGGIEGEEWGQSGA